MGRQLPRPLLRSRTSGTTRASARDFREAASRSPCATIGPDVPPGDLRARRRHGDRLPSPADPRGRDIAAVANVKIGNGSAWQGFYMYVGGTNPPGDHARRSRTPPATRTTCRGSTTTSRPRSARPAPARVSPVCARTRLPRRLRRAALVQMYSSLPDAAPVDVHDLTSSGGLCAATPAHRFLFIRTSPRAAPPVGGRPVPDRSGRRGLVAPDRPDRHLRAGSSPAGRCRLDLAGVRIEWATAPGDPPSGRRPTGRSAGDPRAARGRRDAGTPTRFAPGSPSRGARGARADEAFDPRPGASLDILVRRPARPRPSAIGESRRLWCWARILSWGSRLAEPLGLCSAERRRPTAPVRRRATVRAARGRDRIRARNSDGRSNALRCGTAVPSDRYGAPWSGSGERAGRA